MKDQYNNYYWIKQNTMLQQVKSKAQYNHTEAVKLMDYYVGNTDVHQDTYTKMEEALEEEGEKQEHEGVMQAREDFQLVTSN